MLNRIMQRLRLVPRVYSRGYESDPTGRHPAWAGRRIESWTRWLHGSARLNRETPDRNDYERGEISAEWNLIPSLSGTTGVGLDLGPTMLSDGDPTYVGGHVQVFGASLFVSCTGIVSPRLLPGDRPIPGSERPAPWRGEGAVYFQTTPGREFGVSFHGGRIWIKIWQRGDGAWSNTDPRWQSFSLDPLDLLLGKLEIESTEEELGPVRIPMPEGVYGARARLIRITHRRGLWKKHWWRIGFDEIEGPGGEKCVPYPGKGENSWDCGQDGAFGMSVPAGIELPEAIGYFVGDILRTRLKRTGSMFWTPTTTT